MEDCIFLFVVVAKLLIPITEAISLKFSSFVLPQGSALKINYKTDAGIMYQSHQHQNDLVYSAAKVQKKNLIL